MFGGFSEASGSAARWKRATRSGSRANAAGQHLDCNVALQLGVVGPVDFAHATRTDRRELHAQVKWWSDGMTKEEFEACNVLFQKDDPDTYIRGLFEKVVRPV